MPGSDKVDFPDEEPNPKEKVRVGEIKDLLKKNGLGYIQLQGWWKDSKAPSGFVMDNSFFIPNVKKRDTIDAIATYFNQEGYIYGDGKNIILWEQVGKKPCAPYHKVMNFEGFKEGEGDVGFSELKKKKGKKFYFASYNKPCIAVLGTAKSLWFPKKKIKAGCSIIALNKSFGKYTSVPVYAYDVNKDIENIAKDPKFGKGYDWWAVV